MRRNPHRDEFSILFFSFIFGPRADHSVAWQLWQLKRNPYFKRKPIFPGQRNQGRGPLWAGKFEGNPREGDSLILCVDHISLKYQNAKYNLK